MSFIRKLSAIWKKWLTLILYELTCTCIWLNYFIYILTSPILGTFTEMVINMKPNNKTIHIWKFQQNWPGQLIIKWNAIQITLCSIIGWVWTENIQQLKWLICTALATCSTLPDLLYYLPHPYLGIFAEMVINQKPRHEKLNNVDQSNAKSQMQ